MLRAASRLLSEVMGFLALAALCAGVAPLLFSLPAGLARAIAVAEWAIIALFAVESPSWRRAGCASFSL